MSSDLSKQIKFEYTNWRGEKSVRKVVPIEIWHGESEWHSGVQWFLKASDVEKSDVRDFALVDITFLKS